jgi:hypothetical protein
MVIYNHLYFKLMAIFNFYYTINKINYQNIMYPIIKMNFFSYLYF